MARSLNDEVLPTNSTDRLLAVADQIERMPSLFDMDSFFGYNEIEEADLSSNIGIGHNCNTTACIAGWAIRMLPPDTDVSGRGAMVDIAASALGLSYGLAAMLFFMYGLNSHNKLVAEILRALASLPEAERTIAGAEAVIPALPTPKLRQEWEDMREIYTSLDEDDTK